MDEDTTRPFQELLNDLLDETVELGPAQLYRLSDLEGGDLSSFTETWPQVGLSRRKALMEELEGLAEEDILLSFEAVCRVTALDEDPLVRLPSLRILWEYESPSLVPLFVDLVTGDPEVEVRSSAATALGRFVYMGEVEEIPAQTLRDIVRHLLHSSTADEHALVQRRALESLGYSSHPRVPSLIELAYASAEEDWIASALFAMGRSADRRWSSSVLERLEDNHPAIRFEAARAAGELELGEAVPTLLEQLMDVDGEVRMAAAWSLSQIGGQGVREALEDLLSDTEQADEIGFLEDALDNLTFTEGFDDFSLFDFDEGDLDGSIYEIDNEDSLD
jgi:HEAT repeat protein